MRVFGNAKVIRGTINWTNPFRLRVLMPSEPQTAPAVPASVTPAVEYDEDGREYVFRYSREMPAPPAIVRERLFDYVKRHGVPGEIERQIRRDMRNRADLFSDIRELQTHPDIEGA